MDRTRMSQIAARTLKTKTKIIYIIINLVIVKKLINHYRTLNCECTTLNLMKLQILDAKTYYIFYVQKIKKKPSNSEMNYNFKSSAIKPVWTESENNIKSVYHTIECYALSI